MRKFFSSICLLLITFPAIPQWYQQENIPTEKDLTSVVFTDTLHGWITGHQGVVLNTTDGGNTWELQETGTLADLGKVFFPDNQHGWAVGAMENDTNIVLRTINGGESWEIQYSTDYMLTDLFFTDSLNGWVTSWYNALLNTTDGGTNWEVISFPGLTMPNSVQFHDSGTGYIGGTNHNSCFSFEIYKTVDDGATWNRIQGWNCDWFMNNLFFINEDIGWFTGNYAIQGIHGQDTSGQVIGYSTNGGVGWSIGFDQENQKVNSLYFTNLLNGWAVSGEGKFFSSVNGGESWEEQTYPPYENLKDITFSGEQSGWAVGNNGTVMRTDNNGAAGLLERSGRDLKIRISPNPATDRIKVTFELERSAEVVMAIYTSQGSRLMVITPGLLSRGTHILETSLHRLPSGLYFLELRAERTGQRAAGKFLKR
ncbi:MAG: T9SS type A sorting domain-containing protein [Bacteroidales bacterium]|nr:T9SS type A sorting domain-containing protein [Bacteroidales bacterium]